MAGKTVSDRFWSGWIEDGTVFEGVRIPERDDVSLRDQVTAVLSPEWHPFVENWSRSGHECTLMYVRTTGSKMSMLIVTSEEQGDLTILQMHISSRTLKKWVREPIQNARSSRGESHDSRTGGGVAVLSFR